MFNSFRNRVIYNLFLCCVLSSFTLSAVVQPIEMGTNAVSFGINVTKKIEKLKKCTESSKRISCLLSIKRECERFLDVKFNLKHCFNELEGMLKENGIPIDRNFKNFTHNVKKKDKKHSKKMSCFSSLLMEDPTGQLLIEEIQMKNYPNEHIDTELAAAYETGITLVLVGLFLKYTPHPTCQSLSPWCISTGIYMILDQYNGDKQEGRNK